MFRDHKFWIPIAVSVPVTLLLVIVSVLTADFGFSTYRAAMVFFPYMMLTVPALDRIDPVIALASLFQWPIYAVVIGISWTRHRFVAAVEILLLIHLVATVLAIKLNVYDGHNAVMDRLFNH